MVCAEGLDGGIKIGNIIIQKPVTAMKPLHAKGMIELYNETRSKEIVMKCRRAAGILHDVKEGVDKLPTLDHFADLEFLRNNNTEDSVIT